MKKLSLILAIGSMLLAGSAKSQPNTDDTKYTVVVSLDAFRWDYPDMYDTPNLDRIAHDGLRTVMTPSYPASTFPNHYTIATGMVPDHNGIVNSQYWNPSEQTVFSMGDTTTRYNPAYYLGEPIWVTAGRQGVKTASVYWVGSDVAVKGVFPTYYHRWNNEPRLTFEERVDRTLELLQMPVEERPRLVMTYFDEPDGVGHRFGPRSAETGAMVHHLDSLMGVLYDGIKSLPYGNRVNLVITADHGMTDISDERFVNWKDYVKEEWYERAVCFNPVNIFVKDGYRDSVLNALKGVEHIYVWTHGNVPDSLNYGNSDRTGDVIVAPEIGWQCADKPRGLKGQHGYAPQLPDMRVIFYAAGPSFSNLGTMLRPMLNNVDIYPTLAHIMGIEPSVTDGVIASELLSESPQRFEIRKGETVSINMPEGLAPVTQTALQMLTEDMKRVLDADLTVAPGNANITCSIDATLPREGFRIHNNNGKLHITGADAHGLAYGLLELSHLMGVSAWEDWADVTPMTRIGFSLDAGYTDSQQPAVAYRGIFINDEDWGLNPWATRQEPEALVIKHGRICGAVGPKVTERIFRLMLRLHLNYYWPAMHECTQPFFLTPGNREVAARYGIYIGGSHCEPMASSAAAEWGIRGKGDYNYVTNRDEMKRFWQERLDSVKGQEILYTLGMRGVHDGAMEGVKTSQEKVQYLQMAIDDQRSMLAHTTGRQLTDIPQVFVPYKEVLEIYHNGLRVPDDVTLMWTDDNYGYVRYFPNQTEQQRAGGNGLYYHVSYWGRPHDYCWLSTLSPYLMEQQLTLSYQHGIRKIWMLNVGDIKPAEVQIDLYSRLAWNGVSQDLTKASYAHRYMREMLQETFGNDIADKALLCLEESYLLAWERKPEHMAGTRVEERDKAYWNEVRPIEYWSKREVSERLQRYKAISDAVEELAMQVPTERQDAYFQLVKYPIQGAAQMNMKYLSPELSQQAHDSIATLTRIYNDGFQNAGKWNGIMSAAPRGLRVFQPAVTLPSYPEIKGLRPVISSFSAAGYYNVISGMGTHGEMLQTERGKEYRFDIPEAIKSDSITLQIHLLPNHPVGDSKLTFGICADDCTMVNIDFETYDRSEEWKLNVLRNTAVRTVTLPIDRKSKRHSITFKAMTDGVVLDQIYIKTRK